MKVLLSNIFLLLFLIGQIFVAHGQQDNQDILISATGLQKANDSISFKLSFKNVSPKSIAIFKPDVEYVNYGLMAIGLINQSNSAKFYFNHGKRGDIDNIFLKQEDYIILDTGECYTKQLKLAIKEFSPKASNGDYKVEFMLDYSIVNFTFPCEIKATVFKGKSSTALREKIKL